MADEIEVSDEMAVADESFDPTAMDDAALKSFVGLDSPTTTSDEQDEEAEGDAAAAGALEDALVETVEADVAIPAPVTAEPVEKPKSLYVAYGEDGAVLDTVPVKEVEITVNGQKKRVDMERLARMASSGGYNEQLQTEVTQARETVPAVQAELAKWQAYAQQLANEQQAILADPDVYLARVETYAQQMTPEARAQRAEQALQQQGNQQQQQAAIQFVQQATVTHIMPKMDDVLKKYPNVEPKELMEQFETLIRPYRPHGGPLHPQHVPHVLELIDRAIEPYAAQLHDAREESKQAKAKTTAAEKATQSATATTAKAQATATKAKADIARTIAPVGRVAARPAKPLAPVKTANEGAERALEEALNFTLG